MIIGGHDIPGPAEASGLINIGDSLTKVGGKDVTSLPYDQVIKMIIAAPRPLLLHFKGYEVTIAPDEEDYTHSSNGGGDGGEVKEG
jgi:hypothetical protein